MVSRFRIDKDITEGTQVYFTVNEVADLAKLSPKTIYKLIARGDLIARKYVNSYRIPRSEVDRLFGDDLRSAGVWPANELLPVAGGEVVAAE